MPFREDESFARELDRTDPLASFRSRFLLPTNGAGHELIYFVGHSLGLQPRAVRPAIDAELARWASLGVEAHFKGDPPWTQYQLSVSRLMAHLVGAEPDEVVIMNALTVNLHHMLISFYRPANSRFRILMEDHAFPSDRYAAASHCRLHGYDPGEAILTVSPRTGEHTIRTEDIEGVLRDRGDEIALVLLGGINYYTGQLFELERLTARAREAGCMVGLDLAHAAGNVDLGLHDWGADFAVWCCYKYLNAGPGSLAGCFVHQRHHDDEHIPRFAGWWGEGLDKRFRMEGEFEPMRGAGGWQISNPNVLSLASVRASLDLFHEAGQPALRKKQSLLTAYAEYLLKHRAAGRVQVITPSDPAQRGSQLSLLVTNGGRDTQERLRARDVVCDWRNPNVIRVAPVPLYNTFREVWRFVDILVR